METPTPTATAPAATAPDATDKKKDVINKTLKDLMFGLYYPAVLGAALVVLLLTASHYNPLYLALMQPKIQVGSVFILFFSISFAGQDLARNYQSGTFILDIVELLLMFSSFYFLNLLEPSREPGNITVAYVLLIFVIGLQLRWRKSAGLDCKFWAIGKSAVALLLILAACSGEKYPLLNLVVLVVVSVAACMYAIDNHQKAGLHPVRR